MFNESLHPVVFDSGNQSRPFRVRLQNKHSFDIVSPDLWWDRIRKVYRSKLSWKRCRKANPKRRSIYSIPIGRQIWNPKRGKVQTTLKVRRRRREALCGSLSLETRRSFDLFTPMISPRSLQIYALPTSVSCAGLQALNFAQHHGHTISASSTLKKLRYVP